MSFENQDRLWREAAARDHAAKVRTAYCRVFESEGGKLVLSDLLQKFGFTSDGIENPSYTPGLDAAQVAHREGMKEPVRHILASIRAKLSTTKNNE